MAHSTATDAQVMAEIEALVEPWNTACLARDWDTLLDMCTDDVVFVPPGEAMIDGRRLRPWLEAFPKFKSAWTNIEHVETDGDLACARGTSRSVVVVDGKEQPFNTKFCEVLRREAGKWRCATLIWNDDAVRPPV